jgi:hypothetical protein
MIKTNESSFKMLFVPLLDQLSLRSLIIGGSLKPDTPPETMYFMAIGPETFKGVILSLGIIK